MTSRHPGKPSGQRTSRYRSLLYLATASLLLALGLTIGLIAPRVTGGNEYWLLAILSAVCALPFAYALTRKRLDLFEPIYAFALSSAMYFVLIPALLLAQDSYDLLGWDQRAYANTVTFLALLAMIGFGLGYYLRSEPEGLVTSTTTPRELDDPTTKKRNLHWSIAVFLVFLSLSVLWILVARIPLASLWIFGESSYSDAWAYGLGPQIGYLYGAREALPACLLLIIAFRSGRRWPIITIALFLFLLLFFSGSGARFRVLLLVVSFSMFYFLEKGKRPQFWQFALVAFFIFYYVIGAIGFFRSQTVELGQLRGREVGVDQYTLDDAWQIMVSNSEIATSTAVLVRMVPAFEPYFRGASFLNVLTQPIPRVLWADKPQTIRQDFFNELWPPGTTLPFWAIFYLNFGPLGIIPGMMLWGWISRKVYDAWRLHPTNALAQVQLAVYWPFLIHMYGRGGDNFAFNFYGLIFVLAPVWILVIASRIQFRRTAKAVAIAGVIAQVERS